MSSTWTFPNLTGGSSLFPSQPFAQPPAQQQPQQGLFNTFPQTSSFPGFNPQSTQAPSLSSNLYSLSMKFEDLDNESKKEIERIDMAIQQMQFEREKLAKEVQEQTTSSSRQLKSFQKLAEAQAALREQIEVMGNKLYKDTEVVDMLDKSIVRDRQHIMNSQQATVINQLPSEYHDSKLKEFEERFNYLDRRAKEADVFLASDLSDHSHQATDVVGALNCQYKTAIESYNEVESIIQAAEDLLVKKYNEAQAGIIKEQLRKEANRKGDIFF
jgi:hypothetical protein